jgi:hypothetical protein
LQVNTWSMMLGTSMSLSNKSPRDIYDHWLNLSCGLWRVRARFTCALQPVAMSDVTNYIRVEIKSTVKL